MNNIKYLAKLYKENDRLSIILVMMALLFLIIINMLNSEIQYWKHMYSKKDYIFQSSDPSTTKYKLNTVPKNEIILKVKSIMDSLDIRKGHKGKFNLLYLEKNLISNSESALIQHKKRFERLVKKGLVETIHDYSIISLIQKSNLTYEATIKANIEVSLNKKTINKRTDDIRFELIVGIPKENDNYVIKLSNFTRVDSNTMTKLKGQR